MHMLHALHAQKGEERTCHDAVLPVVCELSSDSVHPPCLPPCVQSGYMQSHDLVRCGAGLQLAARALLALHEVRWGHDCSRSGICRGV